MSEIREQIKSNKEFVVTNSNNRFVPIQERTFASDLPESFWDPIAKQSCYVSWRDIPIQKSPFQIIATQQLIQELKPKIIIEFGSFRGGSALWLADIQSLSVPGGKVISFDIDLSSLDPSVKNDSRIEFIQGDSNCIEDLFPLSRFANIPHPLLLIEDAHINTIGILDYFHDHAFKVGDYFIVEDTNFHYNQSCYEVWKKSLDENTCAEKLSNLNNKLINLNKWLLEKNEMYLVDTFYVDPFGIKNASKNWNSIIKKVR